ncbi:MAG: NADH-quinone oxidoreductase subunit NuoF [Syntrophomonadaceae bacterium]|jgi:NADH:ubiquinone oxidoreductase subunit F (NADH-binding)
MAQEYRIVLANAGKIDPASLDDYLNAGGYKSLEKVRTMSAKELIDLVRSSKLRGRGGAGFNAGMKWGFVPETAPETYVVCNLDEGEPGTYKDRTIVEADPHLLLEGMAICAHAIRSKQGYIYCRGEYPFVVDHLNRAIEQAKQSGQLGDFNIEVRMGGGAYVCGEETALIESIEGHRGEPRFKPPFPGVAGLWGKPTVVNNVETFANLPAIVKNGSEWFASIGSPNYPGTKVFTLTGDVVNRRPFEVPTNTTIRELIFDLGGGIPNGKAFKAVQIGGTSGAFIPEHLLDTPLDFDSMRDAGITLGTGAVFVMDETRDMVDVVTRIAKFFEHESCGKCNPCREGTFRSYELMKKIKTGQATPSDVENLSTLSKVMTKACLCGLGQAAPTPILTTLEHFSDDYKRRLLAAIS